ncbi:MAG: hypothetical protein RhofKO_30650 [Rhodothermales bacterium]
MATEAALPVLIISGTVGSGKTTIGLAVHELLEAQQVPHAFLDVDRLADTWPHYGRFNQDIVFEALRVLWPVYQQAGAERLVLAYVVEHRDELARYEAALGPCVCTIARLTASSSGLDERIALREFGDTRDWHLRRTRELDAILDQTQAFDVSVPNEERLPCEVADDLLRRIGWLKG